MTLRAWRALGFSAVLSSGLLLAGDKPADLPVRPGVKNQVPTVRTQDPNEAEPVSDSDREIPVRVIALMGPDPDTSYSLSSLEPGKQTDGERKARLALETAETHVKACERAEAERWFREVIRQAPRSIYAQTAAEKLKNLRTAKSPPQSAEPPLAETSPDLSALQLRVLWEAARQYREAVAGGDAGRIDECAKSLDNVLKVTKQ